MAKKQKDEILYHYTSIQVLNEILKSGSIWASDCRFLNDRKEFDNAVELFISILDGKEKEIMKEALFFHAFNRYPFVFCLSHSPKVLSQWRAYADDGTGVAIGFGSRWLNSSYSPFSSRLVECVYNDHDQFVRDLKNRCQAEIDDVVQTYKDTKGPSNIFMQAIREHPESLAKIVSELLRIKNPAFSEEQEVRLVVDAPIKNVRTRVRNKLIIPYVEYTLFDMEKDRTDFWVVAPEIWLGPKSDDRNFKSLYAFQQFGWHVNETVKKYDCGYI